MQQRKYNPIFTHQVKYINLLPQASHTAKQSGETDDEAELQDSGSGLILFSRHYPLPQKDRLVWLFEVIITCSAGAAGC